MKPPVGYLIKRTDGLYGERGMFYDYILSGNGIWIEAEGRLLAARVPVALCEVRGLAPLEPKVVLRHGRVPQRFFDLALSAFLADTGKERYVAVSWNDGYHLYVPDQEGSGGGVQYAVGDSVVLDLHSHGNVGAFFSGTDNRDEQSLRLYAVIGKLNETPVVKIRCGVYGYFHPIAWGDVFEGILQDVSEKDEDKETDGNELHSLDGAYPEAGEHHHRWLRWDRWFRR